MVDANVSRGKPSFRNKLGLALAGGGFRASLFHLGVLRRMAELDLLRCVEVLSTVSGGSIIGALYVLLLKKHLDKAETLTRDQYIALIEELDRILVDGIKKNLRTRLLMNPFGTLRVLLTSDTLGRRMARIYERYLYQDIVNELRPSSWWKRFFKPGRISLRDIRIKPGGREVQTGIESYNRDALERRGSVITSLILNATSLNSGAPFRFSNGEIGDALLGFFRYSEIAPLLKRKRVLFARDLRALEAALAKPGAARVTIGKTDYDPRTISLALWWRRRKEQRKEAGPAPLGWEPLFSLGFFPGALLTTEFGLLRKIKLPAWYIRKGCINDPPVTGGLTIEEHREQFWEGMGRIYEDRAKKLEDAVRNDPALHELLMDFVLELYYLRSAEVMSDKIQKHWDALRLGEAVGASACFPPVFPPFIMFEFYEDWHVSRLGLTDGGVYDNAGLGALFEERCNHIIVSDTGGLFDVAGRSSAGRIGMSGRIVSILMVDVANQQRELLADRRNFSKRIETIASAVNADPQTWLTTGDLRGLSFFHINSPSPGDGGLQLNIDRKLLASLRTDLDGFGEVEIAALVNHGYDMADRYLRQYLADYPCGDKSYWTPAQREPKPLHRSPEDVERILRAGRSRLFRAITLGAPLSILFTAAACISVVWGTWNIRSSVQDAITKLAELSFGWIEATLPYFGSGWTKHRFSVGLVILLATVVIALKTLIPDEWIDRFKSRYLRWFSTLATFSKWSRSLALNVFWLVGPVLLVVAFAGAALGWISYLFYYLPFASKARNDKV